jgi:hypothetical protein
MFMSEARFVQPTVWSLSGGGIHVRYYTAGPHLIYLGPQGFRNFTGNEIRVVEVPDLGTLVSVTIVMTVDTGSTSFTVLLPRVNLPAPPALPAFVPVATDAITTVHHLSLLPSFQHGQQEFYTVTPLQGEAG